jgi:lipopolysaccharide export system protein LptA
MRPAQTRSRCPHVHRASHRRITRLALAFGLSLTLGAARAPALEGDQEQPILVEADSFELDDTKAISVYIGTVQIDQGSMRILADHVTVQHREDRRPRFVTALGNPVRYRQDVEGEKGQVNAHAQRMEYDADKDELTLIGQAELTQAADRFASDRIVYDRAQARVKAGASAQGTGRVQITITPEKKPDKPAGQKAAPATKAVPKGDPKPGSGTQGAGSGSGPGKDPGR